MGTGKGNQGDRRGRFGPMRFPIWYLFLVILLVLGIQTIVRPPQVEEISYSEFKTLVGKGAVDDLEIGESTIKGTLVREEAAGPARARFFTVRVEDSELVNKLAEQGITYKGTVESTWMKNLLALLFPIFLFFMIWMLLSRRMGGGAGGGWMSIGTSKAKIYAQDEIKVNFGDIAGVDEAQAELVEVVEFLRTPTKFQSLGGKIPKGVLLVGPPGCGKTLLARAVAGEAGVPFFSISGSEFVEMFVGVGAARVRDLFGQAQKRAPCIIFIDELDALGKVRGVSSIGGHDEREQTLNQLLVEMDGFSSSKGVIIMAATNRPEILDPALLRPGRFDRHILVDRPDIRGREAILKVHVRNVKLADDADLSLLAARTPGFVGADLANMVNEAALLAARRNKPTVTMDEFEEAIDRAVAGLEKKNRVMNKREKTITAVHESGHALVAELLPGTNPVHKVSIIPRGIAGLGFTIQRPTEDRYLMTKGELLSQLAVMLGGRVAEELTFNEVSTGAQNDLQKATDIARSMVKKYGMSEKLGLVAFDDERHPLFLGMEGSRPKEYSEETAREIDLEVRNIIEEAYETVRDLLEKNKDILEKVSETLLEKEVVEGKEIRAIVAEHRRPVEEEASAPVQSPSLTQRITPPEQQ